jgi:bifunctional non-homologous end joining protein LigD
VVAVNARYALGKLHNPEHGTTSSSARELTGDGPTVFEHVCRMALEGIVSKRTDAPYRSGPSKMWLKSKNPASAAVRREREEDWH